MNVVQENTDCVEDVFSWLDLFVLGPVSNFELA